METKLIKRLEKQAKKEYTKKYISQILGELLNIKSPTLVEQTDLGKLK